MVSKYLAWEKMAYFTASWGSPLNCLGKGLLKGRKFKIFFLWEEER